MTELYEVTIAVPMEHSSYFVLAASFDDAAQKALIKDSEGIDPEDYRGRVTAVEIVGVDRLVG